MKYTDATGRSRHPARPRNPVEEATRRQQEWPGPTGGDFLARLAEADEIVMSTEIDADRAMWQRDAALQTIREQHYDRRYLDPTERHRYVLLLDQISRAQPVIDAYEKARRERDRMAAWYDLNRLGSDSLSMSALEAELGPFDDSLAWMERADAKISKQRRNRGEGPARGAVLPPDGEIPPSGNWRG